MLLDIFEWREIKTRDEAPKFNDFRVALQVCDDYELHEEVPLSLGPRVGEVWCTYYWSILKTTFDEL